MDGLQVAASSRIIPEGLRYPDVTRAAKTERADASLEQRWRRAVFGMVVDALQAIHHEAEVYAQPLWKEEARLRANGFLGLALVNSFGTNLPTTGGGVFRTDLPSIAKLAHCYLLLQKNRVHGSLEFGNTLQDTYIGLAAVYQPTIQNIDFQVSFCPMRLRSHEYRSLILFLSCIMQGMLGRASRLGTDARASLKLTTIAPSTVSLQVETCDTLAEIFGSPEYSVARKIAAGLSAEFVWRQGPANGSTLEMQFSTCSLEASHRQFLRC